MTINKEAKVQPKFKTIFTKSKPPNSKRIKSLKYWCSIFHKTGLAPFAGTSSLGNLSFRVKRGSNKFIITASGLGLKQALKENEFVLVEKVDQKNMKVFSCGTRPPSSESLLHYAIYRKRKDINAIFHGHSSEILGKSIRLKIPSTKKEAPYGSKLLVNEAIKVLKDNNFIVLKKHGFVSLGRTLRGAGKMALYQLTKAV
ncbi:MAG: class II aldolase/adducin family protein [Candidatus Margulisiibacteriota bacterium]